MRFGLFGTGPWAHLTHAPALAAHSGVEFAGIWGRDPGRTAELAGRFGVPAYADADALIADVDAIAVALPPDIQAPIALRAAAAGRHLLLDKPIATRVDQARELAAVDVASAVLFTRRFTPELDGFLAEAVATGGWSEARVDHLGAIFTPDNPFGASPWRRERGGLWDVGPHALAVVLPVLGPVAEVTAVAGARDLTYLLLKHVGGAVSRLTLAVDAPPAAAREEAFFAGDAGIREVPRAEWDPVEAMGRALDELLSAAAGGPAPACDTRFGARVTEILAAAERSIAESATVRP
ncbi:Gfo/Idh/MocA family protein [Actinoplanes couchii]|uniref:Gfo/Idh/MocA family protein n=1 Tax=Actinoplanes couchii TaxID=403638 RepID=UPI00194509B8|nr:Gfo/Idh/MocA family oxidoreductase [Actinoplanes couchii]MDR6325353.1 putative dehydrogenase [Actinoplanes couchii]